MNANYEPDKTGSGRAKNFLRLRGILSGIIPVFIMGCALFIPAGTIFWPMAWLMLAVMFTAISAVSVIASPDLIEERLNHHNNAKDWDVRLVRIINITGLVALIIAGLDMRFEWSGQIPFLIQAAATGFFILGYTIFTWAMLKNSFFSTIVRIQSEKGHYAITSGPYTFVRHPGYLGFFLVILFQPLMLGSLWALIPAAVTAALFVVRTKKEDDMLLCELEGYHEYAQKVRYRLIPGIW